jgi:L-asparaginase II
LNDANPIVATVTRSSRAESVHRGFGAVVAGVSGSVRAGFGDERASVYWRSAAKPFQAMPLLEADGAGRFRLSEEEIALTCASHGGEPEHVRVAGAILARGGFREADLRCGAHPPMHAPSAEALLRAHRAPTPLHNNCSGKHAGLLLACRLLGLDPARYTEAEHPLQRRIRAKIAFYALCRDEDIEIGIDGCSLPVFRLPIDRLAAAYARLVCVGRLDGEEEAAAAARGRIVSAMTNRPWFVAGTGRFTTAVAEAGAGRWIGKEGAEGVYALGIAGDPPIGIAFKIEDGSARARDAVALQTLRKAGVFEGAVPGGLAEYIRPVVRNVVGREVGEIVADLSLAPRR